jgi:hypothetical protein
LNPVRESIQLPNDKKNICAVETEFYVQELTNAGFTFESSFMLSEMQTPSLGREALVPSI